MAMQPITPEQRDIDRREEWEDMEFIAEQQRLERIHLLRMAKVRLKATSRYKAWVSIVSIIFLMIPYIVVILVVGLLVITKRPIPDTLDRFLNDKLN